jgi:hypothetical protein
MFPFPSSRHSRYTEILNAIVPSRNRALISSTRMLLLLSLLTIEPVAVRARRIGWLAFHGRYHLPCARSSVEPWIAFLLRQRQRYSPGDLMLSRVVSDIT